MHTFLAFAAILFYVVFKKPKKQHFTDVDEDYSFMYVDKGGTLHQELLPL